MLLSREARRPKPCLSALFLAVLTAQLHAAPLPFVILHGIGDNCSGAESLRSKIAAASGAQGFCIEIGGGAASSWRMPMFRQVSTVCNAITGNATFAAGLNLVGISQGALIARTLIQTCKTLPVVNMLLSVAGPQAGVASLPGCITSSGMDALCRSINAVMQFGVYTSITQQLVAPAGYVKIPKDLGSYYRNSAFLPFVNNEVRSQSSDGYKQRLMSLKRLVLTMNEQDTSVYPKESAHFGFFAPNTYSVILPVNLTRLYRRDTIGLRAMMDAGKVEFHTFPGAHTYVPDDFIGSTLAKYFAETSS